MSTDPRFAEPTPFARLVYAQATGACGDACILVSMAGSIFFSSPTSAARGKVLLFLLITMTPFVIVAPVLGPALDRMKGGRRLFLILSAAGRALLCLALAMYISKPAPEGLLVYPLAFGVLVLQKGSAIAKSALVPALVKDEAELVTANSRLALINAIAVFVGAAPAFVVYKLFGADWSLRFAAVVFVVATILAIQIPRTRLRAPADERLQKLERDEMHTPSILLGASAMAVLRACVGFLAFFTAFSLKHDLFALGLAGTAAYVGNFVGVLGAPALRRAVREEVILASSLVVPAAFALLGALVAGAAGFVLAAFTLGIGAAAGRLGFDSLLQRDGPDAVRGRAFAKFETRFQLVWVIGGIFAIIPFAKQMGLFLLAIVLGFAAVSYVAALRAARGRVMRTKLLPEAVDRTISRSREQAVDRVKRRFRKPARPTGDPPAAEP
ncbi:MAG TPA: MFS transporter [Acidimicrobiia bacterium]|jgi:MFS family permease|nr:MFS transporter [Acidimicrobiia bacterium]